MKENSKQKSGTMGIAHLAIIDIISLKNAQKIAQIVGWCAIGKIIPKNTNKVLDKCQNGHYNRGKVEHPLPDELRLLQRCLK